MTASDVLRARIRQRLNELRLKPADLNRLIGRKKAWAYGYFKGEYDLPIDQLDRLARGLGVSVASLFDESQLQSDANVETKPLAAPPASEDRRAAEGALLGSITSQLYQALPPVDGLSLANYVYEWSARITPGPALQLPSTDKASEQPEALRKPGRRKPKRNA